MDINETRFQAQDLNQQGALLLKAGNAQAAKAKFDQAIELDPMLVDSYKNLGDYYMSQDMYLDSKSSYKKALLIEKTGQLYFLYGNACFMCDDPHEGLNSYNQAINHGYDSDEMMFFMGMAYDHMNDDMMALRYYQKACQKNPSRPDYAVRKIQKYITMRMLDEAEKAVDELLVTSPELYDAYHIKTSILVERKELKAAIEYAKAASDRFPEDAELMYDYLKCLAIDEQREVSLNGIRSAKQMKYFSAAKRNLTMLEAEVEAERANYDIAKECCNACIAMEQPDAPDGEARFLLMNLHIVTKDMEQALEQAKQLIALDEKDRYYFVALYYRAMCLKNLGRTEEATQAFKEANSMYRLETLKNPESVDIYMYRALCLQELEEYDKAMEVVDFLLGITTDVAEVFIIKADIYAAMGQETSAREERERAYKLKPSLRPDAKDGE